VPCTFVILYILLNRREHAREGVQGYKKHSNDRLRSFIARCLLSVYISSCLLHKDAPSSNRP
jgi:hypothetical protein